MKKIIATCILCFIYFSLLSQGVERLFSKVEDVLNVKSLLPCSCEDRISVDLSAEMPPVQDQGNHQDCVGWSLGYALRSYHRQVSHVDYCKGNELDKNNLVSPYYIYNALRENTATGIYLLDGLKFLKDHGACPWKMADSLAYSSKTDPNAIDPAITTPFRIYAYNRLGYDTTVPLNEIKNALKCNSPVVVGVDFDGDYFNPARGAPEKSHWDKISRLSGSHAVVIVGYDDKHRYLKFMNSSGTDWGDHGYGYIHYDVANRVIHEGYVVIPQAPFYVLSLAGIGKEGKHVIKGPTQSDTVRIALDSLIMDNMIMSIEDQDESMIKLQIAMTTSSREETAFCMDTNASIFVRIFTVDATGKYHPLISEDPSLKLGNDQTAFRAYARDGSVCSWYVEIPYQNLDLPKGNDNIAGQQNKSFLTKLSAEPVFYMGKDAVAAGRRVDFEFKH